MLISVASLNYAQIFKKVPISMTEDVSALRRKARVECRSGCAQSLKRPRTEAHYEKYPSGCKFEMLRPTVWHIPNRLLPIRVARLRLKPGDIVEVHQIWL